MAFDPNRLNTAIIQSIYTAEKLATAARAADVKKIRANIDAAWPQVFKSYASSTKGHPRLQAWAQSYVLGPLAWLQNTTDGSQAILNLRAAIAGTMPGISTGPIQNPGITITPVGPGPVGPVIVPAQPVTVLPAASGMGKWIFGGLVLVGGGYALYRKMQQR